MADRESGRERDTERDRERKLPHQGKLRQGKVSSFFEILSLFPYEMFSSIKLFITEEQLSLPKSLPNKYFF